MTFEEAKKILEKEGYELEKVGIPCSLSIAFTAYESPEICEAMQVVCSAGYAISIEMNCFNARKARLKKEYEENTKAPNPAKNCIKGNFPGNKSIEYCGNPMPGPGEEQPEEKKRIICCSTSPKADFYYKHVLNEGNPALKEAASQFNDALLDEQAKKIGEQNKEITRLLSLVEKKENSISRLYYEKSVLEKENEDLKKGEIPARYFDKALVDEQAEKIKKLEHEKLDILEIASSSKQTIAEQADKIKRLGKEISKLNSIIHDKNAVLSDVAEELRLTKIREKNLAELGLKYVGENEKLKKELADKVVGKINAQALKSAESALAYKDKVIADLTKKLNVKHKKYVYYNGTIVAVQRLVNTLASYAAKRYYKELCDQMVGTDIAEEGGDQSATIVQCDNGIILSKEEAEIIERCTKNGTELHYSEKDGLTYTNVFGEEMPIRCLRGMFHVFTDEEIENMKK